jgi:hypothetical protein
MQDQQPGAGRRGRGAVSGDMEEDEDEADPTARSTTRTQPGMQDQQSVTASCGSILRRGSALAGGGALAGGSQQAGPGGAASGQGLLQTGMGLISGMGGGGGQAGPGGALARGRGLVSGGMGGGGAESTGLGSRIGQVTHTQQGNTPEGQQPVTAAPGQGLLQKGLSIFSGPGSRAGQGQMHSTSTQADGQDPQPAAGQGLLQKGLGFFTGLGAGASGQSTGQVPANTLEGGQGQQPVASSFRALLQKGSALFGVSATGNAAGSNGTSGQGLLQKGLAFVSGKAGQNPTHTPEGSQEQQPVVASCNDVIKKGPGLIGSLVGGNQGGLVQKVLAFIPGMSGAQPNQQQQQQQQPMTTLQKVLRIAGYMSGPSLTIAGIVPMILTDSQLGSVVIKAATTVIASGANPLTDFTSLGAICVMDKVTLKSSPTGINSTCSNTVM